MTGKKSSQFGFFSSMSWTFQARFHRFSCFLAMDCGTDLAERLVIDETRHTLR